MWLQINGELINLNNVENITEDRKTKKEALVVKFTSGREHYYWFPLNRIESIFQHLQLSIRLKKEFISIDGPVLNVSFS